MTLVQGLGRQLAALAVIALVIAGVIAGAPWAAREATLYYLQQQGINAAIGEVDVNLFTGILRYERIRGQADNGEGFRIGHLTLSLDYRPLLFWRLRLTRLTINDAAVDVHRTTNNGLRVGGISVISGHEQSDRSNWGLALQKLELAGLRVHYSQPERGDQPAVDRELVLADGGVRDLVTWAPDHDVAFNAKLRVDDSHLDIAGRSRPFGSHPTAHLDVRARDFDLAVLKPITAATGVRRLRGTIDGKQRVDVDYRPGQQLSLTLDGQSRWKQPDLALAGGIKASAATCTLNGHFALAMPGGDGQSASVTQQGRVQIKGLAFQGAGGRSLQQKRLDWRGRIHGVRAANATRGTVDGELDAGGLKLRLGNGAAIDADTLAWQGKASLDGAAQTGAARRWVVRGQLRADPLHLARPKGLELTQKKSDWQGKLVVTGTGKHTQVTATGSLTDAHTAIEMPGSGRFDGDTLTWQGTVDAGIEADATRVDSDGTLKLARAAFSQPGRADVAARSLRVKGKTHTESGQAATQFRTGARIATERMRLQIPNAAKLTADRLRWSGDIRVDADRVVARRSNGRLVLSDTRLTFPHIAVAVQTRHTIFSGHYAQTPGGGDALKLAVDGDLDGDTLAVMNTAIDAPWLSMRQLHAAGVKIDGVNAIALGKLTGYGLELLGDTNTSASVLTGVSVKANEFRLADLHRYRLADLSIQGANIHLRRNDNGMGVLAAYFGSRDKQDNGFENTNESPQNSYAIDHLSLSGPAVAFTDVAVTPNVRLSGSAVSFSLRDIDTASLAHNASYRLGLDVGAYGHLDSRGKIAPLAPDGIGMDLDAWMRSLSLTPLSGYLNAALGRRIAGGVANGTLTLEAENGQLDGNLDTTLSNFRLMPDPDKHRKIAFGVTLDTALALVRGRNDIINFQTRILGDASNPQFSIRNLTREAILAGLRTTLTSSYSPVGLLNQAKNALLSIGHSTASKPIVFAAGQHYIRPDARSYLGDVAQAMRNTPNLRLAIQGYAVPDDATALARDRESAIDKHHDREPDNNDRDDLNQLAARRAKAVRDYLAARDVDPGRIRALAPKIDRTAGAEPRARLSLAGR